MPSTDVLLPLTAESPANRGLVITPDDANDISGGPVRGLWVGGAGAVSIIFADDTAAVTISGVPAGTLLPFAVKRVRATGTTATLITGLR